MKPITFPNLNNFFNIYKYYFKKKYLYSLKNSKYSKMQCNLSFLNYLLIISLLSQIYSQNYQQMYNDIELCMENNNINNCTNVKMTSGVYQCCKLRTISYYTDYTFCSVQVTPISLFKEQMEDKTTKALFKEIFGYSIYNLGNNVDQII